MHNEYVYDLKEMFLKELKKIYDKGEVSLQSIELAEKLSNVIVNLCEICDMDDNAPVAGYSGNYSRASRRKGGGYSGDYQNRNYSSGTDNFITRLEEAMYSSPDGRTRQDIENIISRMRGM